MCVKLFQKKFSIMRRLSHVENNLPHFFGDNLLPKFNMLLNKLRLMHNIVAYDMEMHMWH